MSESDPTHSSRYFKLGLFVLVGVALIIGAVVVLGAGSLLEKTITAETFINESVNGLDVGSAVKYRGVTIGRVSKIEFADAKFGLNPAGTSMQTAARAIVVEMELNSKAYPHLNENEIRGFMQRMVNSGLRARIATAGISGQAYVEYDFLDPKQYPLPQLGFKPDQLYIPSAPSTIGQVLDAADRIASDLQKANLPRIFQHIDELAAHATQAVDGVNAVVQANRDKVSTALAQLPEIAQHVRDVVQRLNQVVHDPRIEQLLAELPGVGTHANAALADLQHTLQHVQDLLASEGDQLSETVGSLRQASDNAAAVTEDARQNPSRLLLGEPPPHKKPGEP